MFLFRVLSNLIWMMEMEDVEVDLMILIFFILCSFFLIFFVIKVLMCVGFVLG